MTAQKKRLCVLFAFLLLLTVSADAFWLSFGAPHCCCGRDCAVCRDISGLKSVAQSFGALPAIPISGVAILLSAAAAFRAGRTPRRTDTLVTQRVKLTA